MQNYSDRKLTCDCSTYSHTSYSSVVHILNMLQRNSFLFQNPPYNVSRDPILCFLDQLKSYEDL